MSVSQITGDAPTCVTTLLGGSTAPAPGVGVSHSRAITVLVSGTL